ncbi:MAG: ribosome recycling factor [Alphaproteobacteria bacterium]
MSFQGDKDLKKRMDGATEALQKEFSGLRTGRASPALLESVQVEAYGGHMPLKELAGVNVPEPRMLSVNVWDQGLVKAVEKAISDANLGLNPMSEGNVIRVTLPELTEDRRRELTKVAGKYAEAARIAVRNVRRDGIDGLRKAEKSGDIAQDQLHRGQDEIQKMTDAAIANIDKMLADKDQDIMQV